MTLHMPHNVNKLESIGRDNIGKEERIHLWNDTLFGCKRICERCNDRDDHSRGNPPENCDLDVEGGLFASFGSMRFQVAEPFGKHWENLELHCQAECTDKSVSKRNPQDNYYPRQKRTCVEDGN